MLSFKQLTTEELSLVYHDNLNPKLFSENKVKDNVRNKLLNIGYMFRDYCKLLPEQILDIQFTGGNANYNYTDISDIDIHLIINKQSLAATSLFIDDFFSDKKKLFSATKHIIVEGYTIECYIQDITENPHKFQGVYSLLSDCWVQEPEYNPEFSKIQRSMLLDKKIQGYKDSIDHIITQNGSIDDLKIIFSKIYLARGSSIAKHGEFAFGNLVFKSLRNDGYFDKIDAFTKRKEQEENYGI